MRQRRVDALVRCAKRAEAMGLPVACTVNPFARPRPKPPRPPSVAAVLDIAAEVTGVSVAEMRGRRKVLQIYIPRHFACWLLHERLGISDAAIERAVNKTSRIGRAGIVATNRRLAEDWPMVVSWRNRAAELLGRAEARLKAPTIGASDGHV